MEPRISRHSGYRPRSAISPPRLRKPLHDLDCYRTALHPTPIPDFTGARRNAGSNPSSGKIPPNLMQCSIQNILFPSSGDSPRATGHPGLVGNYAPRASEGIQLPIQAADYWLGVRRHRSEGDFQRYGYLAGVEIDPRPPQARLVAPAFRFHSATEIP